MQINVSVQRKPGETEQINITVPDGADAATVATAYADAQAFLTAQAAK